MNDHELMQQALEALEEISGGYSQNLIVALRERLAQPEPIKESSVTHSHLWIGDLYGKEKNA